MASPSPPAAPQAPCRVGPDQPWTLAAHFPELDIFRAQICRHPQDCACLSLVPLLCPFLASPGTAGTLPLWCLYLSLHVCTLDVLTVVGRGPAYLCVVHQRPPAFCCVGEPGSELLAGTLARGWISGGLHQCWVSRCVVGLYLVLPTAWEPLLVWIRRDPSSLSFRGLFRGPYPVMGPVLPTFLPGLSPSGCVTQNSAG